MGRDEVGIQNNFINLGWSSEITCVNIKKILTKQTKRPESQPALLTLKLQQTNQTTTYSIICYDLIQFTEDLLVMGFLLWLVGKAIKWCFGHSRLDMIN